MTRSHNNRKGFRGKQKAHHDSPWLQNDLKRKRTIAKDDARNVE